jgi:hypothetical protein
LELLALAAELLAAGPLAGEARRTLAAELLAALALPRLRVGGNACGDERGCRNRDCEDADHDRSPER